MLSNFSHLLPETIFEAVEKLGGRCTGRFLALNAMENRVYDVEKEDETHVIVKFYRPGRWKKKSIQAEHDFLKAVEKAEVPVVCPVADKKGKTLFEHQKLFFALFPKKPGRLESELNNEQLDRLGRFLARLHNVGESFKKAPRISLNPTTYGTESLQVLKDEKVLLPAFESQFTTLVNEIVTLSTPLFAELKPILIHGDCHVGNILWKGNEPYFIDFDDMLYGPPVQDFWMLIGGEDEYAQKNRDRLISAYEEIRAFDDFSLRLIEPLRALRLVYFSAWIARRREDGAFKLAFPHFGTERYWQQQIEFLSIQVERLRG